MYGGPVFTHVQGSESVNTVLSSALRNISGVNGYRNTRHSTMSVMMDNTNISIVDIGMSENMPTEAPEPWTTTMYVWMFIGGFLCGAMTFLMIFVVNFHWEWRGVQRYHGAATVTTLFWAKWHSSMASQLIRRERPESSDDDTESSGTSAVDSLYKEVVICTSDIEYAEVMDWDSDAQAIHYWRPFEDGPAIKTFSHNLNGECWKIYFKDLVGSRLRATGGTCHDALRETTRARWRWGARDSGGI